MSNKRDNSPELDYYELRRRHEEYKSRTRAAQRPEAAAPVAPAAQETRRPAKPVAAEQEAIPAAKPIIEEVPAPAQPVAEDQDFIEDMDEADFIDDEMDDMDEAGLADENPNPFDSFISFFHGVKQKMAERKAAKDAELENMDDLSDEELAALDEDELSDFEDIDLSDAGDFIPEEKPARRFSLRKAPVEEPEIEDLGEEALDIDAAPTPAPRRSKPLAEAEMDEDFVEDYADLDEDEDETPRVGGLKKFLNLFVTRVDENDAEEDDEDDEDLLEELEAIEEEEAPQERLSWRQRRAAARSNHAGIEGGLNMDEMNKPVAEAQPMEQGSETSGMTRRERRELAMRLAAEEAARKAAEEATKPVEAPAAEETPAAAPAIEEEIAAPAVEEPTREFTPLNLRDLREEDKNLFGSESADEEDEGEEDEEEERKPRRGLFGFRKRAIEEEEYDEDEDDYDDEDDDDYDEDDVDEEDEEDEEEERKPRRGLFGRRKRAIEEDDEDDEDDVDDEDAYDDDEDDEYDDYDDEDDDYDDDEDDEYDDDEYEHHSIGYHLIHGLLWMAGILVVLVIAVFVLNFLYSAGHPTVIPKIQEAMGDHPAFDVLFPVYDKVDIYEEKGQTVDMIEATPEITSEPTALPAPEATAAIPNLDANADNAIITAPVVEANPVINTQSVGGSIG